MQTFALSADMFRSQAAVCRYQTASLFEGREYIRRHSVGHELRSMRIVSHFEFEHRRIESGRTEIDIDRIDYDRDFEVD